MPDIKIVGTVGPACDDLETLKNMFKTGLSAVRINTAHVQNGYITKIKDLVNKLNVKLGTHVGIMVDLKGPELRTGTFKNGVFKVVSGHEYTIADTEKDQNTIPINFESIISDLKFGDSIIMNDGKVRFKVLDYGKIKALDDGVLRDRSRINVPGKYLNLGVITERDLSFINEGVENETEFFALSFVQTKENVEYLQELLMNMNSSAFIVSKIETKSGYQNIREIVKVSDLIMVARGDLGVELPLHEVSWGQKKIIEEAHKYGVPTIVATQVLESMVNSSVPTRAEVSDVTNAILDNADAIMLSEETAIGKYPVETIKYIHDISRYIESKDVKFPEPLEFLGNKISYSMAKAAKIIANETNANGIIAFTKSGNTAKMLSAVRPNVPVYAAVVSNYLARQLNLLRNVRSIIMPEKTADLLSALDYISESKLFKKGSRLIITSGAPYMLFGGTNDVRTVTVGKFIGRGYPVGNTVKGSVTKVMGRKADILFVKEKNPVIDESYKHYSAIIFTHKISHTLKEFLQTNKITILYNTNLISAISENKEIMIDCGTGVIIS